MHTSEEIRGGGESSGQQYTFSQQVLFFHEMEWDVTSRSDGEEILLTLRNIPHGLQKCRLLTSFHYGKVEEQNCTYTRTVKALRTSTMVKRHFSHLLVSV